MNRVSKPSKAAMDAAEEIAREQAYIVNEEVRVDLLMSAKIIDRELNAAKAEIERLKEENTAALIVAEAARKYRESGSYVDWLALFEIIDAQAKEASK